VGETAIRSILAGATRKTAQEIQASCEPEAAKEQLDVEIGGVALDLRRWIGLLDSLADRIEEQRAHVRSIAGLLWLLQLPQAP